MHGARPLRSTRRLQNLTSALPRWYSFTNSAAAGQPTLISIYDEIGFYGVPAAMFLDELSQVPGDIELHLHSPGGDIYEGLAIYNGLLRAQKRGNVGIVIDGLAASAASFIAMAASPGQLEISPHARMMVHDGFCMAIGNASDLRELADQLEEESDNIAGIYADRTGKPQAYWREKMRATTWYSDQQAVAEGLADRISGQDRPQDKWDLSQLDRRAPATRNAAPAHEALHGTHSHPGPDGGDAVEHSHDHDADHSGVFDPDGDGDDDSTAEGDTDHDYVTAAGHPGPAASLTDTEIMAMFATELDQLDAGRELRVAPKIPIPASNTELEEMFNDPKVYAKVYADPELRSEFQRKYAAAVMASDPELQAQLKEQIQLGVAEFVGKDGEAGGKVGARLSGGQPQVTVDGVAAVARGKGTVYNKFAPGAELERKVKSEDRFTSIGEMCMAIKEEARPSASRNRAELMRKLESVRQFQNSFGSEDPGAGGFLIPEIMRSELLELAIEQSIVRSRATVIPMSTLRVPIPTVDDTSHVSNLFGGVTYYWAEESAAIPESQASFGRVVLDAKKLVGFFKVPNELLADAPAFSSWFDTRIPMGLAWFEDVAFLTETGAGTPEGFIGSPAYITVARGGSNVITYPNLVNMYARMLPQSLGSCVWIAAHDTFPQLAQLQLSTANASPGIWVGGYAGRDASDAPPVTIFGRPVIFTEKVPKLGSVGDISLVDLSYYLVGDRQSVAVSASEHFAFQNDQTAYRIIERVDGRPWLQTPLTPHNNSANTLSPYVGMAVS